MSAWKDAPPACAADATRVADAADLVAADEDAATTAPVRGLVRRRASAEVFRSERFPAGPELDPWVEHLWSVEWDLRDGEPFTSQVISFPALHLTAEWGRPGEVRHGAVMPETLVHGAVSQVFTVELQGAGSVVGARFRPGGAAAWTGVDAVELVDRAVPATELLPSGLARLHEELAGLPMDERAAGLRTALVAHRPPPDSADTGLTDLVRRMAEDASLVRAAQLVEVSGWSMRTLQRRFRHQLGVSPKWVLSRFRLQEAALAIEREPGLDLSELAVRLGWYDQAHLGNDFRRMLGETPGRYAAQAR